MGTLLKVVVVVCIVGIGAVLAVVFLGDTAAPTMPTPALDSTSTPEPTPTATLTPTTSSIPPTTPRPTQSTTTSQVSKLNVYIEPAGAGTVSPSIREFPQGSEIVLEAIPNPNYVKSSIEQLVGLEKGEHKAVFSHWSGAASGDSPTLTILMDHDKMVVANFDIIYIEPTPIEIDAAQLAQAYAADETLANAEYQHHRLEISGDVIEIHRPQPNEEGYLMLSGGSSATRVMCRFARSGDIQDVMIGDGVVVVGTCLLFHSNTVLIDGCSLQS